MSVRGRGRGVMYERKWAMPNRRTFSIAPIRRFIRSYAVPGGRTLDIFPYQGRRDALEVMREVADSSVDTVLYDPVYSQGQQKDTYSDWAHSNAKNYHSNGDYFKDVEREILRVCRPSGGRCLKFMWNSKSLPGFRVIAGILVAHGGAHHDTICTAYERVQARLTDGPTLGTIRPPPLALLLILLLLPADRPAPAAPRLLSASNGP